MRSLKTPKSLFITWAIAYSFWATSNLRVRRSSRVNWSLSTVPSKWHSAIIVILDTSVLDCRIDNMTREVRNFSETLNRLNQNCDANGRALNELRRRHNDTSRDLDRRLDNLSLSNLHQCLETIGSKIQSSGWRRQSRSRAAPWYYRHESQEPRTAPLRKYSRRQHCRSATRDKHPRCSSLQSRF